MTAAEEDQAILRDKAPDTALAAYLFCDLRGAARLGLAQHARKVFPDRHSYLVPPYTTQAFSAPRARASAAKRSA